MDNCVAVISIIVEDDAAVAELNELLHRYGDRIVGRLGIPYRARGVNIICVAIDAPRERIEALVSALERIGGVNATAAYSGI